MEIEFKETGQGPAILFLPGSFSTAAAWRGVWQHLSGSYRLIASSLPGYGSTPEIRDEQAHDMSNMIDFAAAAVAQVDEPVHLVGHSFGGFSILAALHARRIAPLSLVTFEANPIGCRPPVGDYPWRDNVRQICLDLKNAYASGDPDAAGLIVDYWSRRGTFEALPVGVKDYCRQTVKSNILDWQCGLGFSPRVTDFSDVDLPSTIVRGEHANLAIVDLSQDLARELKSNKVEVVSGADHFLISTHPEDCARIIDHHIDNLMPL